jgi:hypothetical protein
VGEETFVRDRPRHDAGDDAVKDPVKLAELGRVHEDSSLLGKIGDMPRNYRYVSIAKMGGFVKPSCNIRPDFLNYVGLLLRLAAYHNDRPLGPIVITVNEAKMARSQ